MEVRAKKYLGQHFLKDENIAAQIADSLTGSVPHVLEIGPGMGVMTKYLLDKPELDFHAIEIDRESVDYLHSHYPSLHVIEGDFLQLDLSTLFPNPFAVIGNFPYNISSQILFRVYDNRNRIPELVGMFQKEVAERVCAAPGSKTYGILSVLLSAFYDIEYLFTVHEHVFNPPPKVKSAVIRMRRNSVANLDCDEQLFTKVVKIGFNQRRKTLRNALKQLNSSPVCFSVLPRQSIPLLYNHYLTIMSVIEYIILSFALAVPVMVSLRACALKTPIRLTRGLGVSFLLAVIHSALLLLGLFLGNRLRLGLPEYDNLFYLGLMLVVGVRMFFPAFSKKERPAFDISRWSVVLSLAVATAINTLLVGLALGFRVAFSDELWKSAVPLFIVMFLLCYLAVMLGRRKKTLRERRWQLFAVLFLLIFAIKGAFFSN